MSPARRHSDSKAPERLLRGLGALDGESEMPLAEAALALAARDRPGVALQPYRDHLELLEGEVGRFAAKAPATIEGAVSALNSVILISQGYAGDQESYDDLRNANLMHVIDRRKGLPVALGILYIAAARAQGWLMQGLAFPGHFLVRLERHGQRAIIDPFNGGVILGAQELRDLLKATAGLAAEIQPEHYAPVPDRQILLRLQNNIKMRLLQDEQPAKALAIIESMLLFAPNEAGLWREGGLLNAQLGNLGAAIAALEECQRRDDDPQRRHRIAALLQRIKGQLN